jgi:SulP family sulfate permease
VRQVVRVGAGSFAVAIVALFYAISFAAIIFRGPLAGGLGLGVDAALLAIAIGGAIAAWRSRLPTALAGPDSNPTAVLAFAVISLGALGAHAVPIALATVALATGVTGLALYVLGRSNAARAIRFIPYPMIGGFNAASGVLVAIGAWRLATDHAASTGSLAITIGFAALVLVAPRVLGRMALPALVLLAIVGAHLYTFATGATGWYMSVVEAPFAFPWQGLARADLPALASMLPSIASVVVVSVATLLLNATGLETLGDADVDLDRELRTAGIGNLVASLAGAMVSYVSFTRSSFAWSLGLRGRVVGIVVAALAALCLIAGPRAIGIVPSFLPPALLLAMGASIAYRWLVAARRSLSTGDMVLIWTIVATVAIFGFVVGIVVGLAIGCAVFAIRYGRIDVVDRRVDLRRVRSGYQRSNHELAVLQEYGDRAIVYGLRGYMFFGVADRLYRELMERIAEREEPIWLVLDFSGVTGMDSSVGGAFVKLLRRIDPERVHVLICGLRENADTLWRSLGDFDSPALSFDGLDDALEWCEAEMLRAFDSYVSPPTTFDTWLENELGTDLAARVMAALERVDLKTGEVLYQNGARSGRMYFVRSGRIAIVEGEETPRRVRSLGPQTIVGEMELYGDGTAVGVAIAEVPTTLEGFSRDALDELEGSEPHLAAAFHAAIVRALSERLAHDGERASVAG